MQDIDYKYAREHYEEHKINKAIAAIPLNVNRAGKRYRQILREISDKYEHQNIR